MGAAPAARVTDQFGHTCALDGVLIGLAVGIAAGALILATGGLGAIAIGAAIGVAGGAGLAGEAIGATISGPPTGALVSGAPTVLTNMLPQAAVGIAMGPCAKEYGVPQAVASGVPNVLVVTMPAARKGETMTCSAKIVSGSANVMIGGDSQTFLPVTPEVPQWLNTTLFAMSIGGAVIATGGIAAEFGIGAAAGSLAGGLGGSYLGGIGGKWAATEMGYGATGQAVGEVMGSFAGGAIGGGLGYKGGQQFDIAANRATAHAFYENQGYSPADIPDHVKGIDLTRPVTVETLPAGTELTQYQVPGGRQGNYYAPPGTKATELGISPQGQSRITGAVENKVAAPYKTTSDVQVLKSTAAPITDTWSIPGQSIPTQGGGTQYFSGQKGAFGP
ncbi:MAG: PAAR domain-containing protein [Sphingomonadales bacterium]|nr:PAAR domain-containing protein [Sphingomonadales bacterium]